MYKITLYSIGKPKEPWLQEALAEYEKRLKPFLTLEWVLVKTPPLLEKALEKQLHFLTLDPQGKMYTSPDFSTTLLEWLTSHGSRLHMVIGGADGMPPSLLRRSAGKLSLSPMTLTHQMTRLFLLEQIYRAIAISRGSSYHK